MKKKIVYLIVIVCFFLYILFNDEFVHVQEYNYKDVTISDFANMYLNNELGYDVSISPEANDITTRFNFGVAHSYPIKKTLLVASKAWKVKFYIDNYNIKIFTFDEESFCPDGFEEVFSEPLPKINSIVFSKEENMCGPNCLALISYALGRPVYVEKVVQLSGMDINKGASMYELFNAAKKLGLNAEGRKLSLSEYISKYKSPVIVHADMRGRGHFLVLKSFNLDNGMFSVIDPPYTRLYTYDQLNDIYTGNALFIW